MTHNTYIPAPVDTSDVELTDDINILGEKLAKNTHETWAAKRIAQGWKYGAQRNDVAKTHPCLVPYENLSEEEKEYDRNTSIGTLKTMIKLGYKIKK